jgi:hypothetical protein
VAISFSYQFLRVALGVTWRYQLRLASVTIFDTMVVACATEKLRCFSSQLLLSSACLWVRTIQISPASKTH